MKKKNVAFTRSKRKIGRNPKQTRSITRNKSRKLRKTAVKKAKPRKIKKVVARPTTVKAPKQAPRSGDLLVNGRKLDTLSSKIDKVLSGLDSLTRKQVTHQISHEEMRNVLASNQPVKQQETLVSKSEAPIITAPVVTTNPNLSNELKKSGEELDKLKKEEDAAKARLTNLNLEFEEIRGKVDALQKYYITQNQSLDGELEARRKTIHQRIEDERTKAESEIMLLLRQRDESRDLVRNLSEEKDSLRRDVEFAKSLSRLIKNPESIGEAELAALSERFDQVRIARPKGARISNSKARMAFQRLLASIGELGKS